MRSIVLALTSWLTITAKADTVDTIPDALPAERALKISVEPVSELMPEIITNATRNQGTDTANFEYRGRPIFHFRRGDVKSLRVESISSSRQVGHAWRYALRFGSLAGTGRVNVGYVLPTVDKAGDLAAVRSSETTPKHTMFRVVSPQLYKGGSLKLDRTYRFAMRVRPINFQQWPRGWVIALQAWGPTYPTDARWRNPPMFVRVKGRQWQAGIKGGHPNDASVKERVFSWPFTDKEQTIEIEYRPSAKDGLFRVTVGGKVLGELSGTTSCTHDTKRAGVVAFGQYGTVGSGFAYREVLVEQL